MFGRLKDWRRVATRYDRCPKVFLSAVALAATPYVPAAQPTHVLRSGRSAYPRAHWHVPLYTR